MLSGLLDFFQTTGFALITWKMVIMWAVVVVLLWLAIAKGFEPLLLIPIAFGALVANLPTRGVITAGMRPDGVYETATFKIEGEIVPNTAHGNATRPSVRNESSLLLPSMRPLGRSTFCRLSASCTSCPVISCTAIFTGSIHSRMA